MTLNYFFVFCYLLCFNSFLCIFSVFLYFSEQLIASTISALQSLPASAFSIHPPSSTLPASAHIPHTSELQESLKSVLSAVSTSTNTNIKQKQLFLLLRYILSGNESGPSVSIIIGTMGRDRAIHRLQQQQLYIP